MQASIPSSWQKELQQSIRGLNDLELALIEMHADFKSGPWSDRLLTAQDREKELQFRFKFSVTLSYLEQARPDDPRCPILAQVLPSLEELDDPVFEREDPLAEESHMPVVGLTHRYPDRVLWYLSHHCAVYCRFCMRKRKVAKAGSAPTSDHVTAALDYIRDHPEILEVILSGGDPLSLQDEFLDEILHELKQISHVISVRIHSRMPVTLPSRITEDLVSVFRRHAPLTFVTHFNHAREISPDAQEAIRRLRSARIILLNQSVLLRGVNDSEADLRELFLDLIRHGVKPYYLHQCDEVKGVSHFRVSLERGVELMKRLRGRLPGIALPLYVVDLPGGGGKVPVDSSYRLNMTEEGTTYQSSNGKKYHLAPFEKSDRLNEIYRLERQSNL